MDGYECTFRNKGKITPMKDDDKPVISLAAERKKQERDFAQERDNMIKELSELGLPSERAAAIAEDVLYCDWLVLQATIILERWDLEQNAQIVDRGGTNIDFVLDKDQVDDLAAYLRIMREGLLKPLGRKRGHGVGIMRGFEAAVLAHQSQRRLRARRRQGVEKRESRVARKS